MINKKKIFSLAMATAIGLCSTLSVSAETASIPAESTFNYTIVEWSEEYTSIQQMTSASDVNIIGTVVTQDIELRGNLYVTHSFVETDESQLYDIVQIGAIVDGEAKNVPYDLSLLEIGEEYLLWLNQTDYHELYGQYYLIAGGNQGYALYDSTIDTAVFINSSSRNLFSSISLASDSSIPVITDYTLHPASTYSDSGLQPSDCIWDHNPKYYIKPYVETNYGSAMVNQIKEGAPKWNGITSNLYISRATTESNADIVYYMNDYGFLGSSSAGYTSITGGIGSHPTLGYYLIDSVDISLNVYNLDTSCNDDFWVSISCHEMGHAIGLNHNNSENSIMSSLGYAHYYWENGWIEPQAIDRSNLRAKYDQEV